MHIAKTLFLLPLVALPLKAQPAKFEPPDGFVYHGVGQPPDGIPEYIKAMGDSAIYPLVHKLYFPIPGTNASHFDSLKMQLTGLRDRGIMPELGIGFSGAQGPTDSAIASGPLYDAMIDSVAEACRMFGRRMFVRPGYEFNGPWNAYHPYLYVAAFDKLIDRFRAHAAADSVAFLWCYAPGGAPNDFDSVDARGARWYPGDSYVDWFSLDVFDTLDFVQTLPDTLHGVITAKGRAERFLAMALSKKKPVYLSETSAKGMDITSDSLVGVNAWNRWFAPFWYFIDVHHGIKGFSYINWDWTIYPQWAAWGDARIQINPYIVQQYRAEMRRPKYIHLLGPVTSVQPERGVATGFALAQNYPNPFNPSTTIRYALPERSHVVLSVYNTLGQQVVSLVNEVQGAGYHEMKFDGSNVASGVYFYRLQAGGFVKTLRAILLK